MPEERSGGAYLSGGATAALERMLAGKRRHRGGHRLLTVLLAHQGRSIVNAAAEYAMIAVSSFPSN